MKKLLLSVLFIIATGVAAWAQTPSISTQDNVEVSDSTAEMTIKSNGDSTEARLLIVAQEKLGLDRVQALTWVANEKMSWKKEINAIVHKGDKITVVIVKGHIAKLKKVARKAAGVKPVKPITRVIRNITVPQEPSSASYEGEVLKALEEQVGLSRSNAVHVMEQAAEGEFHGIFRGSIQHPGDKISFKLTNGVMTAVVFAKKGQPLAEIKDEQAPVPPISDGSEKPDGVQPSLPPTPPTPSPEPSEKPPIVSIEPAPTTEPPAPQPEPTVQPKDTNEDPLGLPNSLNAAAGQNADKADEKPADEVKPTWVQNTKDWFTNWPKVRAAWDNSYNWVADHWNAAGHKVTSIHWKSIFNWVDYLPWIVGILIVIWYVPKLLMKLVRSFERMHQPPSQTLGPRRTQPIVKTSSDTPTPKIAPNKTKQRESMIRMFFTTGQETFITYIDPKPRSGDIPFLEDLLAKIPQDEVANRQTALERIETFKAKIK